MGCGSKVCLSVGLLHIFLVFCGQAGIGNMEGTVMSQEVNPAKSKSVYAEKGEELRTIKQLITDEFLNIFPMNVLN